MPCKLQDKYCPIIKINTAILRYLLEHQSDESWRASVRQHLWILAKPWSLEEEHARNLSQIAATLPSFLQCKSQQSARTSQQLESLECSAVKIGKKVSCHTSHICPDKPMMPNSSEYLFENNHIKWYYNLLPLVLFLNCVVSFMYPIHMKLQLKI